MYDLFTDGLAALKGILLFRTEKFAYQGMMGITSGSNRVFQAPHHPLLSAETTEIYLDGVLVEDYTLDIETGVVRFDDAPEEGAGVEATYYRSDYTDTQLKNILLEAFRQMEMRWPRGYRVSSSAVTFAEATILSDAAYVVAPAVLEDPVIAGAITFGSSQAQRGLLLSFAELVRLEIEGRQAAITAFSWREDRGTAVDRSRVPSNIRDMIAMQNDKLYDAMQEAQNEFYTSTTAGGYLTITPSKDYSQNFDWRSE